MRMKKNICAILACAMIFGAFSIPVAEAKEEPEMQIMAMRATGEFNFEIPAKTLMKASSGFPMEYGETVKITASYSPSSASVDFWLIDSNGVFYPVQGSNGSINRTIRIDLKGTYTFAVRNNSGYSVNVSGYVNY